MFIHRYITALAALAASVANAGEGPTGEPLAVTNTSPFVADRLLPAMRSAAVLPGLRVDVSLGISSHFIEETTDDEFLFVDGETNDLRMDLRYGISERWDLALVLPYRQQRNGFLDGVINDWHDVFGLPDGGRSEFPNGVLDYAYVGPAVNSRLTQETAGLGDVSLATQYVLQADSTTALSIAAGLEFDTGDPAKLTGSGGSEAFVALRFSGDHRSDLPIVWHGQVGYSRADRVVPLGAIAERSLWFAGLNLDWRLAEDWSLLAQVDMHTAPFDSAIDALGRPSVMLSLAARRRFSDQWSFEVGFSEDIAVETAPDVVFFSRLSFRP